MASISGFRIAKDEAMQVFRHWQQLVVLGLAWSAVATAVLIGFCIFLALYEGHPIDIGRYLERMSNGDLMRQYSFATGIGSLFGQLATAIGWTRLVLLGEQPQQWLSLPYGSARYFGRCLILLLLCVLLIVPGVVIGGLVGTFAPNIGGRIAGAVIIGMGGLTAMYVCMRMWLVFPAIAIQDDTMTMRRSLQITGAAPLAIVVAPVLAYLPFLVIMGIIDIIPILLPAGNIGTAVAILVEFSSTFLVYAAIAASSGAMAVLYETLVPASPALAQAAA